MLKYFIFISLLTYLAVFQVQAALVKILSPNNEVRGEWSAEVAATPQEREIGLMNRPFLAENSAMLFDMSDVPNQSNIAFWMKNTFIKLDILFADKNGLIFYIKENAQPLDETLIIPPFPPNFVLEINGGQVHKKQIEIGDVIHKKVEH